MDLKLLQKILRMMSRGDVRELEIDDTEAGLRIHVRRGPGEGEGQPAQPVVQWMGGPPAMPMAGAPAAAPAVAPSAAADGDVAGDDGELPPGVEEFPSPMVGTFYTSPSPDADEFVRAGDEFGEDTVLCIIEAMKVMNEIKAESIGEIVEVLVNNSEPVEFGQPLFLVKKR
ncbi:MAG: acetyl-CoA carboxylase biotin carboxyl carrier protein [Planctomycetota bacterium]|jgi:acetyl-CoA carboxylase biotin carboxyl carrier protein|nr:acetyl-CoA carboxylase, biotin carboxyl carrier protein [Planctomycetota bacterium]MDP6518937.1 acetyl-CoA carboxylase biotin carboxyl carrier protein [Planctomycetota bacterium]MDP6839913.1 acetyl-CoA carboxylase biotin carboxyl carrier protein [Planctomycetota bacterium]